VVAVVAPATIDPLPRVADVRLIDKCLFPVAGYGTRFLPAAKAVPKEMLPIVNKPLLQFGVEEAVEAGMRSMCFVTGRGKRAIEDHFDRGYELENEIRGTDKARYLAATSHLVDTCSFAFVRQVAMKGLGHAILRGRPLVGDEPFAVVLPDDLCFGEVAGQGVLAQMVALYREFGTSIVAIEEVPRTDVSRYGVIAGDAVRDGLYRVREMVEKPAPEDAPSNLAIIGRYVLTPDIFAIIERTPPGRNGEIQITDALLEQARQGRVLAYRFRGRRFDCGVVPGFVAATNHCYEHGLYETGQA
jgi:UTP--glucose-1-phosphate uridylyltransferase